MIAAVSQLNTGGKYDSKAFKKSVGMNGVGVKAVNFLSTRFEVRSYRDGVMRRAYFERGILKEDETLDTQEENGTFIFFEPDETLFTNYRFQDDIVCEMLRNYIRALQNYWLSYYKIRKLTLHDFSTGISLEQEMDFKYGF